MLRGFNALLRKLRRSCDLEKQALIASSFVAQASLHVDLVWGFPYLDSLITKDNASQSGRPKIISAGDTLQSGSGVFLTCRRAISNLSLFSDPAALMYSIRRRLHFFTATSARPFDCGKCENDLRCLTPHLWKKIKSFLADKFGTPVT